MLPPAEPAGSVVDFDIEENRNSIATRIYGGFSLATHGFVFAKACLHEDDPAGAGPLLFETLDSFETYIRRAEAEALWLTFATSAEEDAIAELVFELEDALLPLAATVQDRRAFTKVGIALAASCKTARPDAGSEVAQELQAVDVAIETGELSFDPELVKKALEAVKRRV